MRAVRPTLLAPVVLAALAAPAFLTAQQGTVTYTHVVKRDAPQGGRGGWTPPPQTNAVLLHFSPTHSLLTQAPREARGEGQRGRGGDGPGFGGGDRGPRRGGGFWSLFGLSPDADADDASTLRAAYLEFGAGTTVEVREFLGREFRMTREPPTIAWRLTADQAEHLGYTVIKATADHNDKQIEAWFTPQIPVPGGPGGYGGLPGMILVLSVNRGQVQYQATEVTLEELDNGLIRPPEEGDEISREAFEEIVRERIEEAARMRRRPGGAGGLQENER